jgi:NAD(P)H-dependent flavin oxidoreductase YrpB (nitropropane dioxygenase family)
MALTTRFTELAGCRVPIQQAPMGSVSTPALAVAVADAGGVGSITALGLTAVELDKVLAGMAAQTAGVLAANFLTEDMGGQRITLAKGHGLPPGAAATGHIEAMAMYAGESAAAVPTVEPAAHVIQSWWSAVEEPG